MRNLGVSLHEAVIKRLLQEIHELKVQIGGKYEPYGSILELTNGHCTSNLIRNADRLEKAKTKHQQSTVIELYKKI